MTLRDGKASLTLTPVQRRPDGWCLVRLDVESAGRSWSALDECLTRGELRKLARWLREVGRGRRPTALEFTEPNLVFECVSNSDRFRLRVWFEGEVRPSWAPYDDYEMRDLSVELDLVGSDVLGGADALRAEVDGVEAA